MIQETTPRKRYRLISCEIFYREICSLIANSPVRCDVEFLPKGLHDLGVEKMRPRIQERIDAVTPDMADHILMGYGLCNNGIVGLTAGQIPLVVPRAHDCITLFLGDRARYRTCFEAHPGTYYLTSGWLERNDSESAGDETVSQKLGLFLQYEELVQKYGEDNARYIMETMGDAVAHYDRVAYINMGLACETCFRDEARAIAAKRGWSFDELAGSMDLLRKLVYGDWDSSFLIVPPGGRIAAAYDDGVIRVDGPK
ncbi:MAG: hypothetical protein A2498_13215 [Lentisphaerae bacterium RIFOXYC12_FULL_60_16]|nr:MAG: hypothetical protein A2498_13215 [Lentisphaerae bacterium RIFOXYC12_FULL_60_16]OGV86673.1 MAG: hypothetical protein A2340_12855 [Lentisphaerae bacterium RIFOXYB12_FULL_60_10]